LENKHGRAESERVREPKRIKSRTGCQPVVQEAMKNLIFPVLFFILAFTFSTMQAHAQSGKVFWRGMVDDKVQLVIKSDTVEENTISGQPNPDGIFSFTSPLPDSPVSVTVNKKRGRGKARVTQQPAADNDFTAIVEIYDDGGGAREYQLEIFWK